MRRITIALLTALTFAALAACEARAQQPAPTPAPTVTTAVAQPTAEQKANLRELAKQWDQKAKEADSARDKYMIALLSTLAELGLKPSETSITWNNGEPVFNRVEQAKTTPPSTAKPQEKKP